MRRVAPYLAGAAGVILVTAAIGAVRRWLDTPALTVAYIVLVVYVGARSGRLPALTTAVLGFAVYEFFFVPPFGSPAISAPRDAISLVLLLAAAALSERIVGALVRRSTGAEAKARESQSLYEVAFAALGKAEPAAALELLCQRAAQEPGILSMTILEEKDGRLEPLAGSAPSAPEASRAGWVAAHEQSLGVRLDGGRLALLKTFPTEPAYVRLPAGVAVIRVAAPGPSPESARVLAALAAMAGLLLDRRRVGEQAERARSAEESDRLKTSALSALTHDVKTPLASLQTGLGAMELDPRLNDEQRQMLRGLESQAARLDRILHNVLTLTRLDVEPAGVSAPVSLPEVVGSAVTSLERVLSPFRLEVRVPEDLPPVLADEVELDRVFTNLLDNAAHWAPAGAHIEVGARAREARVEAWVENEGPDIPPQALSEIFASYWTQRPQGSGLGLAICRRIVEKHGGSISVRNTRRGPRFTVRLAIAAEAGPDKQP